MPLSAKQRSILERGTAYESLEGERYETWQGVLPRTVKIDRRSLLGMVRRGYYSGPHHTWHGGPSEYLLTAQGKQLLAYVKEPA